MFATNGWLLKVGTQDAQPAFSKTGNHALVQGIRALLVSLFVMSLAVLQVQTATAQGDAALDQQLSTLLAIHKFTGRIEQQLEERLGRPVDAELADLGR